jgi:GTP-binding protein
MGMIVGENSRADDIDVNPTKEKKLTNHRAATADDMVRLAPPRPVSLELALETIATDEVVEVTPKSVRLRKAQLDQTVRGRESKRARVGAAS